jgi:hypothetical protein
MEEAKKRRRKTKLQGWRKRIRGKKEGLNSKERGNEEEKEAKRLGNLHSKQKSHCEATEGCRKKTDYETPTALLECLDTDIIGDCVCVFIR